MIYQAQFAILTGSAAALILTPFINRERRLAKYHNLPVTLTERSGPVHQPKSRTRELHECRIAQCALAILLILGLPSFASAQNIVQFIAGNAKSGPAPTACKAEAAVVASIMAQYKHPDTWKWIIACDEPAWRVLINHLGVQSQNQEVFAETDRTNYITYVRGYTLLYPLRDYPTVPENVIVHELAHIDLNSGDEELVERVAQSWISKHHKEQLLVSVAQHQ